MARRLDGRARSARRSHGFTLVELLVVITIIGILMSLLLPAVQAARAAAQEAACKNNIKQLGLAALSHEQQYGWFPVGGWGKSWNGDPNLGFGANQPGGFFYNLLPFIEQSNLWAYGQTGSSTTILQVAQMPVVVYNCPSRRPLGQLPMGSGVKFYANSSSSSSAMASLATGTTLARCDYAVCGGDADKWGSGTQPTSFSQPTSLSQGQQASFWLSMGLNNFNGACVPHSQIQSGAITRGRTGLFLVGEKYLDPDNYLNGQDPGDNTTWDMGYDANVVRWAGGGSSSNSNYLPTQDTPGIANSVAFGSTHFTGFGMAFADGHVGWLNYTIDPTMYGYLGDRNLTSDTADMLDDSKW
ncbi:MAG TPA: DUF1559 domain-containing protein [Pirellulales bacterium]|nr:DUF1559 domain-containing protein [Pirellulales bacterium]